MTLPANGKVHGSYANSGLRHKVRKSHEKFQTRKAENKKKSGRYGNDVSRSETESLVGSVCCDDKSSHCEIATRKISVFFQKMSLKVGKGLCWLGWGICFCSPETQNSIKRTIDKLQKKIDDLKGSSDAISHHERAQAEYEQGNYISGMAHDIKAGVTFVKPKVNSFWQSVKDKFKD